jgi:hypothetical protein
MNKHSLSLLFIIPIIFSSCQEKGQKHTIPDVEYVIYAKDSSSAISYWVHDGDTDRMYFNKYEIKKGYEKIKTKR